tara:strand:+ start:291 stop:815 length:525 start_codon:yes stop_codon:yes gene_type:complete
MKLLLVKIKIFIIFFILTINAYSNDKIVYVNMDSLINDSKAGISINNQMKKILDKNNSDYQILEKKLREEEKDLLNKKNVLDPDKYNTEVNIFKNKINKLKIERNKEIEDIQKRNIKAKNELVNIVTKILAKYSADNEIELVLRKESIVLGKKNIDITNEVLTLLDKEIKKIKF